MSFVEEISCHRFDWRWNTLRCNRASRGGTLLAVYNMALDYPQASANLRSRSVQGMQQQTALAIRSVISTIEKLRLKRKQKPPRYRRAYLS